MLPKVVSLEIGCHLGYLIYLGYSYKTFVIYVPVIQARVCIDLDRYN